MSIMIPLLIVVTTVVMVGASFAWFTNADKVTVTEITMSTAESYRIDFNLQKTRACATICSTSVRPLFATAERMPAN